MNHSKKQVINEQVWKSLAKVLDSAVAGAKFLDPAVMKAAQAVKAAAGDVAKLRAISSFLTKIENSATDLAKLDEIADDVVENFDDASKTRLNTIDDSMELAIKEQGSVTDDLLRQYRRRLDNELQFDPALGPIKEKIINKQVNKWKTRSGFGGGTAAAEQTLRAPGGVRSFDEVMTEMNNALKNEVPPKQITKEQLTKMGKDVDDLMVKYENGLISNSDIAKIMKNNATELSTIIDKAEKFKGFWGASWDLIKSIFKEPGSFVANAGKYWSTYGKTLWKGIMWVFAIGISVFGLTILGTLIWDKADDANVNPFSDNATGVEEFGNQNWTCIKSIPGVNKLDENGIIELAKIKINNAKLGCANTAMDAPDNIFVTGISVEPGTTGDPRAVIKLDFKDGTSKKYVGGKEIGGGTTPPPTPGNCVWKTEADAKDAVKKGFPDDFPPKGTKKDDDIRVDLTKCKAYYTPLGLTDEEELDPSVL
jgi:hypothetical protein